MKLSIFTLLFVEVSFIRAQSNLINPQSTLVSSVVGLLKDVPSLLNDPSGGVSGIVLLVPAAIKFSNSVGGLSGSVDDFSRFISTSPDAKTDLTQNLDCFDRYLDEVIVASYNLSQNVREQTDEQGYLNFFNFSRVLTTLNELTAAHNGVKSCIKANINGIPSGSSEKSLDDVAKKIRETSDAQAALAGFADPLHGVTGFLAGVIALLLDIAANYAKLSTSLHNFSNTINNLSESSFSDVINAVNDLARTEHRVSVAFYRLSELS